MGRLQNVSTMPVPPPETHPAEENAVTKAAPQPPEAAPVAEEHQEEAVVPPTREQVEEFAGTLQEALTSSRPENWSVNIHEDTDSGSFVIEIKDAEGEVIKQFPPEKVLNLRRKLDDLAGVVVDETT